MRNTVLHQKASAVLLMAAALAALATHVAAAAASDDDTLAVVLQGCAYSRSIVCSSSGTVAVHEYYWRTNGEMLETETLYHVTCRGNKLRASIERRHLANGLTVRGADATQHAITPGTVDKQELAYDGQKVVSIKVSKNRATVGTITTPLGSDLRNCLLSTCSPGHGVMEAPRQAGPAGYARTGPRVIRTEKIGDDECVVLEETEKDSSSSQASIRYIYRTWVNPHKGYTVPKAQCWIDGGKLAESVMLAETTVEVRPYGNDLWGIAKAVTEQRALDDDTGKTHLQIRRVTQFDSAYALNPPVTDEQLSLNLPRGMKVYDEALDAQYTVP